MSSIQAPVLPAQPLAYDPLPATPAIVLEPQATTQDGIAFGDHARVSELLDSVQCNFTSLTKEMSNRLKELGRVTELGKSIAVIDLPQCSLTATQIQNLLTYFPQTRYFTCKSILNKDLGLLKGFKELLSLSLIGCEEAITNAGIKSLIGLRIRRLELSSCTLFVDILKKFPLLEQVQLRGVSTL